MTRSQKYSFLNKQPIFYTDFDDSFGLNPITGELIMTINELCIIQSIKNLVYTNLYERFYQPLVGSKVQSLNFEMNDPTTRQLLITTLTETIQAYEPRAQNLQIQVMPGNDDNNILINILFTTQNLTVPVSFTLVLPRVR